MRHIAALEGNPGCQTAAPCYGELDLIESNAVEVLERGRTVEKLIHVYRCRKCRDIVPIADGSVPDDSKPPAALVADLARSFKLPE